MLDEEFTWNFLTQFFLDSPNMIRGAHKVIFCPEHFLTLSEDYLYLHLEKLKRLYQNVLV